MSNRSIGLDEPLYHYLLEHSLREPDVLAQLRAETANLPEANMQIAPEQGQFMALLAKLMGARRYLEIGTFTGYSALAIALVLPEDGEVVTLDKSADWTASARRYWERAGVAGRIRLELGEARNTLQALEATGETGRFDLAFIDADKTGYPDYFEHCLRLVRRGGLILIDNTLWHGTVADPDDQRGDTRAIRAFNDALHHDERIDLSLAPIGDGLTLARRR
ncbi:class I SAM-dependent methyltransferase [Thioalkalivibrio sp. AKL19]|uniref:class I SAM-dependent methyltransferase n=1 Tax=Thioalkalivibrio sp. AKL19 TaxID=1266914 RepID=UPI0004077461|nr:class I SAM-dependent methyltransferase [Thioalkalivibrio sp. AKL19]